MQKVMPVGPDYTELGRTDNDYSTWIFTYTDKYHLISEGANELTAKLSCTEPSTDNEIGGSPNKSQDFADDIKNDPSSEVTGDEASESTEKAYLMTKMYQGQSKDQFIPIFCCLHSISYRTIFSGLQTIEKLLKVEK